MARIRVDFPAPFGPMSASQPPPLTAQLTALTTGVPSRATVTSTAARFVTASPPRSGADGAGAAQHPDEGRRADEGGDHADRQLRGGGPGAGRSEEGRGGKGG